MCLDSNTLKRLSNVSNVDFNSFATSFALQLDTRNILDVRRCSSPKKVYTSLPKLFVHLEIASVVFGHFSSKLLFEKQNGDFIWIYVNFHMLGFIWAKTLNFCKFVACEIN